MDNPYFADQIARLKDQDRFVRQNAADVLGQIGDAAAVPALLEALKDQDEVVRWRSASVLGDIGGASAVPALLEALKDAEYGVRRDATIALGKIGDAAAVPGLLEALKDMDASVRWRVANALGEIGDAFAVPALIEALTDKNALVRGRTVRALHKLGDSLTLPRKILASSRWSAQERVNALEKLRRVRYHDPDITLHFKFPETRALCRTVLDEEDAEAREGAQIVLDWLNGDRHLLRASQPDTAKEAEILLRAAEGGEPETRPDTLLRAGQEPTLEGEPLPPPQTLWQRLLKKRNGSAF